MPCQPEPKARRVRLDQRDLLARRACKAMQDRLVLKGRQVLKAPKACPVIQADLRGRKARLETMATLVLKAHLAR